MCVNQTCIKFPPVDLSEEGLSPELVAGAVPEAEPPLRFLHQQALADGAGLLTELLRIHHWIVQDALLHHLIFHLQRKRKAFVFTFSHSWALLAAFRGCCCSLRIIPQEGAGVRLTTETGSHGDSKCILN